LTSTELEQLCTQFEVKGIIYLEVDTKLCLDRICNRRIHLKSNRRYNLIYNPPKYPNKDDLTDEPLTLLKDDNILCAKKRLEHWDTQFKSLLLFVQNNNDNHPTLN